MAEKSTLILVAISALLLFLGLFVARPGIFIIDEVIYLFAADTFRTSGSLILENGHQLVPGSGDLLWTGLLSLGPGGFTSQYPAGTAIVWAPLIALFGVRGIVLLHTITAVGTLFATRALAVRMFEDKATALGACLLLMLGTFTAEYAFTIWPHMPSVFTVVLSIYLLWRALEEVDGRTFTFAFLSGLVLGAGATFRIDNILVLPAIAIIVLLYARQPLRILVAGALGLVPSAVVLGIANQVKFGTLNPVSYGAKGGATTITAYLPFAVILVVLLFGVWVLRRQGVRIGRPWIAGFGLLGVAAIAVLPPLQSLAIRTGQGIHTLIFDARALTSPYAGVVDMPDGTKSFWGLAKKSLGQSAPWIGLLLLYAGARAWAGDRRQGLVSLLIIIAVFAFPFLVRSWHGGMSSNMRYFLPVLPFVAMLAAYQLRLLFAADPPSRRIFVLAFSLGLAAALFWITFHVTAIAGAHQILSLYVFAAVSLLALIASQVNLQAITRALALAAGMGVGISTFNMFSDTAISQLQRGAGQMLADLTIGYEGKVLIYGHLMRSALMNPDQVVAVQQFGQPAPDPALVEAAIADGFRVLMPAGTAEDFHTEYPGYAIQASDDIPFEMVEIIRSAG